MRTVATLAGKTMSVRSIVLGLVSLFVATVAPLIAVSPASAVGSAALCDGYYVCLYQHKNYGGNSAQYYGAYTCYNVGSLLNNQASSLINNTGFTVRYYDNAGCSSGCYLEDGPYSYRQNLAADWYDTCARTPNDHISSIRLYTPL